jgi:hypothetical protein
MPSTSKKQERAMRAAAHDKKTREAMGIPKKVAEEFVNADERKRAPTDESTKKSLAEKAEAQAMSPEIFKALYGDE